MRTVSTTALAIATALTTVLGGLVMVAMLPVWPLVAEAALGRRTTAVGWFVADALLCLGPLCIPLLLLLGGVALEAWWNRRREARTLCTTALGGWAGAAAIVAALVV